MNKRTKKGAARSASSVNVLLGKELRRLREARHLTVRKLANALNFSPSFISQLENGQTSPSIASLERIAGVLGVGLKDLFAQYGSQQTAFVPIEERPAIVSEWSKARIEALTVPRAAVPIDGMMVHLEPGGSSGSRLHAAPSHRFAFIWKGSVTLSVDDKEYKLKQGDAIALPIGALHRWNNHSRRSVRIVIVSFRQS